MALLVRYRAYLLERARPLSGLALANEFKVEVIPWFILALLSNSFCWIVSVPEEAKRWIVGVTLCVCASGFGLVVYEFARSLGRSLMSAQSRSDRT